MICNVAERGVQHGADAKRNTQPELHPLHNVRKLLLEHELQQRQRVSCCPVEAGENI